MESIGLVIIYLMRGALQGTSFAERINQVQGARPQMLSIEQMCEGLPFEMAEYMNYCR